MKSNSPTKGKLDVQDEHSNAHKVANDYLHKVFLRLPAIIYMFRGPDHTYEFSNEMYLQLVQYFMLAFNESAGRFMGNHSFLAAIMVSYSIPAVFL